MPSHSLGDRTFRNVAWLSGSQAIRAVLGLVATLFLTRHLGPTDYGEFAVVLAVSELAQAFVEFGTGSALIQRSSVDRCMLSTCFWVNLLLAALAAAVLIAIGPALSAAFRLPGMTALMVACGLNVLLTSLLVLPRALLSRSLEFREIALATLAASLAGTFCAVVFAIQGFGVWALVSQPLVGAVINLVWLQRRSGWWPSLEFSAIEARALWSFSVPLLGGTIALRLTRILPNLILGPALGFRALGTLTMAQTIAEMPVASLGAAVAGASLPALARMQHCAEQMRSSIFRASELAALLAYPILMGFGIVADDVVPVVFGSKWSGSAPLVKVLCLLTWAQFVTVLAVPTLLALGRTRTLLRLALFSLLLTTPCLWLSKDYGLFVSALALALAGMVVQFLTLHSVLATCGANWTNFAATQMRPMLCSVLMAVAMLSTGAVLQGCNVGLRLVAVATVGLITYLTVSVALNRSVCRGALSLLADAVLGVSTKVGSLEVQQKTWTG